MAKLRLFAAVGVPEDRLELLQRVVGPWLGSLAGARPVPLANQHITVKFIGWLADDLLEPVVQALARACAASLPAELALGALGAFPHARRARLVWAGVADPAGGLAALAARCERALLPLGVAAEARPYRAHLTLARLDPPRRLAEPLPEPPAAACSPFVAGELVLYRSHLGAGGARYEALHVLRLGQRYPEPPASYPGA